MRESLVPPLLVASDSVQHAPKPLEGRPAGRPLGTEAVAAQGSALVYCDFSVMLREEHAHLDVGPECRPTPARDRRQLIRERLNVCAGRAADDGIDAFHTARPLCSPGPRHTGRSAYHSGHISCIGTPIISAMTLCARGWRLWSAARKVLSPKPLVTASRRRFVPDLWTAAIISALCQPLLTPTSRSFPQRWPTVNQLKLKYANFNWHVNR